MTWALVVCCGCCARDRIFRREASGLRASPLALLLESPLTTAGKNNGRHQRTVIYGINERKPLAPSKNPTHTHTHARAGSNSPHHRHSLRYRTRVLTLFRSVIRIPRPPPTPLLPPWRAGLNLLLPTVVLTTTTTTYRC